MKNLLTILVIVLSTSVSFTNENCGSAPQFDGLSSASRKFKFSKGEVCETYVEVTWRDGYSNGSIHTIKYGTTKNFGKEINLKPFKSGKVITTRIENLSPETTYYGQVYRKYGGKVRKLDFQFTTKGTITPLKNTTPQSVTQKNLTIRGNTLFLPKNMPNQTTLSILNLQGRKILSHSVRKGLAEISLPKLPTGIYYIQLVSKNNNYLVQNILKLN